MRHVLSSALLLVSILGCELGALAEEPKYSFQAADTALHALAPDGKRTVIANFPVPIDSLLSVGNLLYVVYAKRYIEVFDVSNPTAAKRRTTLTVWENVAKLQLGSDGSSILLLTTAEGATGTYSLADPLHPAPLLSSPPLSPLGAKLEARTYRDYGSVHPMIWSGIAVVVLGGALLAGGVYFINQPDSTLFPVRSLLGFPLTISGGLHILIGGGLVVGGAVKQKGDKRPMRPAYLDPIY